MPAPWDDYARERRRDAASKAHWPVPFHEVVAEPAEAKAAAVVSESGPRDHTEAEIAEAGRVRVSVFQAEVDDSAADESHQVRVRVQRRRQDAGQNIQDGHELAFTRQRQIDELLDLTMSEQRSNLVVFST